ncbi:MAG: 23S rRNA (uracil(1939)-C(5))-methyltransferase RlmD [Lachnospiraceae bacterium]|nr:23S rRNA (uracil(1939)-C(5))-methyltransferase RlmD [Lachnospiraceae bacterium]
MRKMIMQNQNIICPHFGKCGGCSGLDKSYEQQLNEKKNLVWETLSPVVVDPLREDWFEGIKSSPMSLEYRNKMEFTFGDEYKDGPLALGMHKKRSFHDIVTVDGCQLVHPDFRVILRLTLDFFSERNIPYFHRKLHTGFLRHLMVRRGVNSGQILVDLVTTTQMDEAQSTALLKEWTDTLITAKKEGRIIGEFAGILHTRNDTLSDAVKDEGTEVLHGADHFFEDLMGLKFRITPFSFFQTNSSGAEVLYGVVREYVMEALSGDDTIKDPLIFDLYSGTGTIAQVLSAVAKRVIGVEIVEEAVLAARKNAELNGLHNCEFHAGDVMQKVKELSDGSPDLMILDPPRDGCHPKALPGIIDLDAKHIVYVSCKVKSLARDLIILQDRGYKIVRAVAVDEFPQTEHVETVCLLSNRKPDTKVRIDVDLEDYYRIKDSKKNQD